MISKAKVLNFNTASLLSLVNTIIYVFSGRSSEGAWGAWTALTFRPNLGPKG